MFKLSKYKSRTCFLGLPRCKVRAYGAKTNSPPVIYFYGGITE